MIHQEANSNDGSTHDESASKARRNLALASANHQAEDPQRRGLAMALLGALGGAALLEACAAGSDDPEQLAAVAQGLTGTSSWFDRIIGTAPALSSAGSAGTSSGQIAIAAGRSTIGDGGGGVF